MITNYIELTIAIDDCKNLIPIESIEGVGQIKRQKQTMMEGREVIEDVTVCKVLIKGIAYHVKETYEEVKTKIDQFKIQQQGAYEQSR